MDSAKPLKEKCIKKDVLLKEITIERSTWEVAAMVSEPGFKLEVTFHLEESSVLKTGGNPL